MSGRGHYSNGIDVEHDVLIAVGAGKFTGVYGATLQGVGVGLIQDVDNPDVLAPGVPTVYPSDASETITVASSNASDTGIVVRVNGLDENFDLVEQEAVLLGTATVPLTGKWARVNAVRILGPSAALGTVTVSGPSGVLCYANARDQRSVVGRYSVPTGYTVQVLGMLGSMTKDGGGANAAAVLSLHFRRPGLPFSREFGFAVERRNSVEFRSDLPEGVVGPADLEFRGYADASDVDALARSELLIQEIK